jgi:hypothetical protein
MEDFRHKQTICFSVIMSTEVRKFSLSKNNLMSCLTLIPFCSIIYVLTAVTFLFFLCILGKQSLETICLLLAYKIKYPENFFLLRGNHECASINRIYGNLSLSIFFYLDIAYANRFIVCRLSTFQ